MVGADYAKGPLVAGLSLSHSRGLDEYAGVTGGQVASSVTGLYPWLGYKATDRVTVWGVAGYGAGGPPTHRPRRETDPCGRADQRDAAEGAPARALRLPVRPMMRHDIVQTGRRARILALLLASLGCIPAPPPTPAPFSVVEASVAEMQEAMAEGRVTSRWIVQEYLQRIAYYENSLNAAMAVNRRAVSIPRQSRGL